MHIFYIFHFPSDASSKSSLRGFQRDSYDGLRIKDSNLLLNLDQLSQTTTVFEPRIDTYLGIYVGTLGISSGPCTR
jgi:hypothetical protein